MATKAGEVRLDTAKLDAIAASLGRNTDQALASIAFQAEAETKSIIQQKKIIDTSALFNSIHTERKKRGLYWVADGVLYGIYNELGTSRMAARPFMKPAIERVNRFISEKFKALFK